MLFYFLSNAKYAPSLKDFLARTSVMQIHPFLPGIRHIRDLPLFPNFDAIFVVKRILLIGQLDPVFLKEVPLSLNERLCAHFTSYAFKLINMKCLRRLGFLYLPQ
jgi:hypothetical protein